MVDKREYIDIMAHPAVSPSRWDRGDGETAIRALEAALELAGLPDALEAPKRLLARAEQVGEAARQAKQAARERLAAATEALLGDGPLDAAAYGQVVGELAPWLDDNSAAMIGMMTALDRLRANATATAMGQATGLYAALQGVCREVVAEIAAVPAMGRQVMAATNTAEASSAAMRAGRELEWGRLVRLGERFDAVHAAALLLRETGALDALLLFQGGCPTEVGVMFLGWQDAVNDLPAVRRLPGPLRVRAAHDRGWRPGLWTSADHAGMPADEARQRWRGRLLALGRVG
jgi:hypothetical protein